MQSCVFYASTHTFTHWPSGAPKTTEDPAGFREFFYTRGRLATVESSGPFAGGYTLEREPDALGRHATLTLKRGTETLFTRTIGYNGTSREPATLTAPGFTATYGRASAATRAITGISRGVGVPPTLSQTFTRGPQGRIESATAAGLAYTHTQWDARGRRKNLTTPYGDWSYEYDSYGQLQTATRPGKTHGYGWDGIGRRAGSQDSILNQFQAITNPPTANLFIAADPAAELYIGGTRMTPFAGVWTHPLANPNPATGAWIPWTVRGILRGAGQHGADPDAKAALSGWTYLPPQDEEITYDAAGNRATTAQWEYRWDARNQLVRATTRDFDTAPHGWDIRFAYDAEGRRCKKTVTRKTTEDGKPAVTREETYFVWDDWNLIYERHENQFGMMLWDRAYHWGEDLAGGVTGADGVGGAGALLLIRDRRDFKRQVYVDHYPCYDTSGNVIALTDAAGAITARYDHGPFGEPLLATGPESAANPIRWASRYYDAETGLYYFGHRYYDPRTAQWLTREPLGEDESLNLYSYCHNDPVNKVDVLGLDEVIVNDGMAYYHFVREVNGPRGGWLKRFSDELFFGTWNPGGRPRKFGRSVRLGQVSGDMVLLPGGHAAKLSDLQDMAGRRSLGDASLADQNTLLSRDLGILLASAEGSATDSVAGCVDAILGGAIRLLPFCPADSLTPLEAMRQNNPAFRQAVFGFDMDSRQFQRGVAWGDEVDSVVQVGAVAAIAIPCGGQASLLTKFQKLGGTARYGAKGGHGPAIAWNGFDVNLAGGPLRQLSIERARVTQGGIGLVERHVARFGPDAANQVMVNRLNRIAAGEMAATPTDLRFYLHEIREGVRYRNRGWADGVPANVDEAMDLWRQTHSATLYEYGLPLKSEHLLYVPEALQYIGL